MMKVPASVRGLYLAKEPDYTRLQGKVDQLMVQVKHPRWHYESRVKSLESFALKLETGRVSRPEVLEDFFACTLVVENYDAIGRAETLIKERFKLDSRRPQSADRTHKKSDSFPFDDLRLYVRWRDAEGQPTTGLSNLLFEIQVKTFLQHAWAIATHDLIYKAEERSWPEERIAFQIKAMLEHADLSIREVSKLAASSTLPQSDKECEEIKAVGTVISEVFEASELPKDKKRLATAVHDLLSALCITPSELKEILLEEGKSGRGAKTKNLSPYAIIIQSIINQKAERITSYLTGEEGRFKVLLCRELILPDSIDVSKLKNAVLMGERHA